MGQRKPTGQVRPGRGQVRVLHLESKRAGATIGSALMGLVAVATVVAALLYRTEAWPAKWRFDPEVSPQTPLIVAAAAGALALLFLVGVIVNGRRWHIARVVEKLSEDHRLAPHLPDTTWTAAPQRAAAIPPLEVAVLKTRQLPKLPAKPRRVTARANVLGHPPVRIAYLRLFENQPRIRTFIEGPWREFGYVYLLRSAASVTPDEYRMVKRSGNPGGLFISSYEELIPSIQRGDVLGKGRYRFKTIGPSAIKVRDRYGSYSVHALLCHGSFWREAVDVLLDRVDLVALDLSGFRPENVGTHYELQRVIDRFPIERVVFLADPFTKKKFVADQIQAAWSHMAAGSPNAGSAPKRALVVVTDVMVRRSQTQQTGGPPGQPGGQTQTTQVQVRLVAQRRPARRVVAMAESRAREWDAAHGAGQ